MTNFLWVKLRIFSVTTYWLRVKWRKIINYLIYIHCVVSKKIFFLFNSFICRIAPYELTPFSFPISLLETSWHDLNVSCHEIQVFFLFVAAATAARDTWTRWDESKRKMLQTEKFLIKCTFGENENVINLSSSCRLNEA